MIIGIDGNEGNIEKKVGISEYAFELLTQFAKYRENTVFRIYLKHPPRKDLPEESENWQYRIVSPKPLWTQFGLPVDLYRYLPRPSVFFTPTHYAPRFSPIPMVVSVMDLSYIHFPQLFRASDLYQLTNWTAYSVKKAKKVFTISNASKNDIIKVYNVPSDKVIVTYPGIKPGLMKKTQDNSFESIKEKYSIEGDYVLFVGTIQPRKNIAKLIEAFEKLLPKHPKLSLILVGKKGWLYEDILKTPEKLGIAEKVKFLDFVSDNDLPVLYKHAQCFVLPSLYEGFGLPVLEAMSYGCPVVTSNVSSLPESGGDAALYIDPNSAQDIAEKIESLLTNKNLREQMIEKGYKQIKKFSWEKTAKETLEVLQEVGGNI